MQQKNFGKKKAILKFAKSNTFKISLRNKVSVQLDKTEFDERAALHMKTFSNVSSIGSKDFN